MNTYKRVAALPSETVGSDLLVVDADRDLFFSSNPVGAFIWANLDSSKSIDDLTSLIVDEFEGADPVAVKQDVQAFVDDMCEHGIVERTEGAGTGG